MTPSNVTMRITHRLLLLLVALIGCSTDASGDAVGAIRLAAAGSAAHDVEHVRLTIVAAGDTCAAGPVVAQAILALGSTTLPDELAAGDGHPYASRLFTLPEGDYVACAEPLDATLSPSAKCAAAQSSPLGVVSGQTTEVTLWSTCEGDDQAGLDVVGGLNGKPLILDVDIRPSKWIRLCEPALIELVIDHVDGDDDITTYSWLISSGPVGATLDTDAQRATFTPLTVGDYTITVTVSDGQGGASTLTFPIHVRDQPCVWSLSGSASDIAIDPEDNIFIIGTATSGLPLGLAPTSSPPSSASYYYAAKITPGGTPVWVTPVMTTSGAFVPAPRIAVDDDGHAIVLTTPQTEIDLGCGPVTPLGSKDFVVTKLSGQSGSCLWDLHAAGSGEEQNPMISIAHNVRGDTSDDTLLFSGTINSDTLTFSTGEVVTLTDPFNVLVLAASGDGSFLWAKELSGSGQQHVYDVAGLAGPTGCVLWGGFGQTGGVDTARQHVTAFDVASGATTWSVAVDVTGHTVHAAATIAPDREGHAFVALAGYSDSDFHGVTFDFGDVTVESQSTESELVVFKLDGSTGARQWLRPGHAVTSLVNPLRAAVTLEGDLILDLFLVGGSVAFDGVPVSGDYALAILDGDSGYLSHLESTSATAVATDSAGYLIANSPLSFSDTLNPWGLTKMLLPTFP